MNSFRVSSAALLIFTVTIFTGCYTQLASDKGDYYGYTGAYHAPHRAQPVRSDTVIAKPAPKASAMTYDTIMHGDTMFIEERMTDHPPKASVDPSKMTIDGGGETVINNYY